MSDDEGERAGGRPEGERAGGRPEGGRLEDLRRGLYRPSATDRDVAAYLAQRPATAGDEAEQPPVTGSAGRRWIAVAVPGVLVAGALLAIGVVQTRTPDAVPTSAAPVAPTSSDEVLTPYGAIVPLPTPAAVVAEGEAAAGQRYRGTGDMRFPIDTAQAPQRRGRAVVRVVAVDGERMRWDLTTVDPSAAPIEHRFASGPASDTDGVPITAVLPYRDGPPSLVEITAPTGARWVADVAFLPADAAQLR